MNLYLTVYDYLRSATGLETASLLGNISRLSGSHAAGATTLTIATALTVPLLAYDPITIFDGASSEVVTVNTTANIGATSITLKAPGLAFAHSDGTPWCSPGTNGSLADEIVSASTWLENITQQSLYQTSYTETLHMPGMRASINSAQELVFRPRHFPVVSDSAITIKSNNINPVSYDASQVILDGTQQIVSVPWLLSSNGGSTYSILPQRSRTDDLWLTITYTAGYTAIPGDVRDAAILLTSDILSRRKNPTGAAEQQLGKQHIVFMLRGDTSGDSMLVKRAMQLLQNYSVEAY